MTRRLSTFVRPLVAALVLALLSAGLPAAAQDSAALEERIGKLEKQLAETRAELAAARGGPSDARLKELEHALEVLTKEIEALKLGEAAAPEAPAARIALGPAASRVYGAKKGVSIGGYGEFLYQGFGSSREDGSPSDETATVDLLRAVLYFGYKFDERFVFNSEIEVEHAVSASDKEGEVEVEFATLDYLHSKAFNARAGLVLIPMGLTNLLHEPPTFSGARRPDVEQVIIPTTWRELGFGAWGDLGDLSYQAYLVNGLNASGYDAEEGIREGRQEGSEALAKNWAVTGRLDYHGVPGLVVGASIFSGGAGQGLTAPDGQTPTARTTVWDLHADYRVRGFELRGLYARTAISDAAAIDLANGLEGDESVGSRQYGWYLQGGFDLFSLRPGSRMSLVPFLRYERWDTQDEVPAGYARNPEYDVKQLTLGIGFKPIENVVLKVDWQQQKNEARTGVDRWNISLGYLF
ncbi:MAG: ABC transporter C-terminal domain-containing protein [Thermoanaerobaculia bacterium]